MTKKKLQHSWDFTADVVRELDEALDYLTKAGTAEERHRAFERHCWAVAAFARLHRAAQEGRVHLTGGTA
jgi:hypothetical protein